MNNKGFAITTVVFAIILLLSLIMLTGLAILKDQYTDQKDFINHIDSELNECLRKGDC